MKLYLVLAWIFLKEIKKVFKQEISEKNYLAQEDFDTSLSRAKKMISMATERIQNILALAIAYHRQDSHKENKNEEIAEYSAKLSIQDVKTATRRWWKS